MPKSVAWKEGIAAFPKKRPDQCPYFNPHGDYVEEIRQWIKGWSAAYKEAFKS